MSALPSSTAGERVLVLMPTVKDGERTSVVFAQAGIASQAVPDLAALCEGIRAGSGPVLLTEEAIHRDTTGQLNRALSEQPPWSALPLVVLSHEGVRADVGALLPESVASVTLVERPVRVRTLISVVRAALRARRQQYEIRDALAERERQTLALAEQGERLYFALTAGRMGSWELDVQTRQLDSSELNKANYGRGPGDRFTYDDLLAAIHHADRARAAAALEKALRDRSDYEVEYRVVWPDDSVHAILCRGRAAFGADGKALRVVGVSIDLTEIRRNESALQESEGRYRALVEQIRDYAIFTTDTAGRATSWNPGVRRVLRFEESEFIGLDVSPAIFVPEDIDRGVPQKELDDAARYGSASNDRWMRTRDGTRFFATGVTTGLRDHNGRLIGFSKVMRDQTEWRQAQEDLARITALSEQQRRLYQTVFDSTPDLVYVFDREHRFTFANRALLEVWGKGAESAVGKTCLELGYTAEHAMLHDREIDRVLGGESRVRGELEYEGRIYDYIFVPVLGANGEVEAVAGSTREVTERKHLEIALAERAAQLKEADRRKDEFLATLAHELRNPLAPVRTGLQVIKLDPASDMADKAREMMERQLVHMVRLIDDLLDLSRITRGKVELKRSVLSLDTVVDAAVEGSRPQLDAARHAVAISRPSEPLWVDADLTRLAQVLSNLLNNSAKYTPRGGHIALDMRREGQWAVIEVKDDGVGIPTDKLTEVFEMFSQVNRTLDRSQGGLGIGLALVRKLLELHGGTITAYSAGLGTGSTFTIRLPLATPPRAEVRSLSGSSATGSGRRILVVDDNVDGADCLSMLLSMSGHQTRTAHDGPEALTAVSEFEPEVVFLDIGLPGMSGYDVARRLREEGRPATLIALTGWGSDADKQQAMDAGFDFHLTKPVEPTMVTDLLSKIRAV